MTGSTAPRKPPGADRAVAHSGCGKPPLTKLSPTAYIGNVNTDT